MYKAILIAHIIIGAVALLSGLVAIISSKGKRVHNTAGKAYYISMYGVALSALIMTLIRFNPFLLSIAIFSFYMTYGGKQAIDNWRMKQAYVPTLKHKLPLYFALLTSLFMVVFPFVVNVPGHQSVVRVLTFFGLIMLLMVVKDIKMYGDAANFVPRNKQWLLMHIAKMGGAYIATFTAFLVNNVSIPQGWILWIAPGIVGSVLITRASKKWARKLKIA
jgi:uncharacterized membrane protein